jgi:hypothetical protein
LSPKKKCFQYLKDNQVSKMGQGEIVLYFQKDIAFVKSPYLKILVSLPQRQVVPPALMTTKGKEHIILDTLDQIIAD